MIIGTFARIFATSNRVLVRATLSSIASVGHARRRIPMCRLVLSLTFGLVILPVIVSAQSFDPYQIVGFTPWCLGFNPYELRPGQPAPTDFTIYDAGRCFSLDVIDQQTVTKLSLPEAVVGAPGSELAWLIVHQTDRAQIQNVLVQADG